MNRREFLLFVREGSDPVAELSCEKLFMHYQDLTAGYQQAPLEAGTPDDADWWAGEPALNIASVDPEQFFRSVLESLKDLKKLRVVDMEWLSQGDFRIRVETLLAAFQVCGGQLEYAASPVLSEDKNNEEVTSRS